jgi:tetratricopeptide (TPR) repeat protein/predicted Ser/Thr protein kinase
MIGTTISHYRILGQIGEGGMGVVYVAEDTRLGRRVAVKIPHAGRDERHYHSRFLREARATSALNHPNIAAVYDYGETEDGAPFIVMELVTGQTLGDLLLDHGLTLARAVEIIEQVAAALAEAHRQGIVHRDVKPSNVIINDRGEVKVLDFGLAKQLNHGEGDLASLAATRSDVVIGTPLYLSPEQARGSQVDGRSDIFALGALLYECVAGRPAFSGANVIEIGAQVLHFNPPPPSHLNPRVPAELDRVTLKALAKRPEERYQTAEEMAAELARVRARLGADDTTRTRRLTTDAHLARPSALNTLTASLRRKRFSPLGVIVAAAVVALVGAAVYYFLLRPSPYRPAAPALEAYERGVNALREGAFLRASVLFGEAAEADKKFALAYARRAEALLEMDYLDRAMIQLVAAQQIPERATLARHDSLYLDAVSSTVLRRYAEAVKHYEALAQLNPDSPQVYVDLGRAYEKNNETQKALDNYTTATRLDQNYAAAYLRLGALQARLGNQAGMTEALDRAAQLYRARQDAEGEAEVHYQRGSFHVAKNRMDEARRELTRARELAAGTRNLYQQVQALLQLSHTEPGLERASALVEEAIEMARADGMHDQAVWGYLKLGAHNLTHGRHEEADRNLRRALDHARDYKVKRLEAISCLHLASLRNKQQRPDEALQFIQQARDFYEQGGYRREADAATMLAGRTHRQKGDYASALRTFGELLARAEQAHDPALIANARRECGVALYFHERHPEALAHLDEAYRIYKTLKHTTQVAYAQLNRANVLWRMGRYDEARAALDEASQIASAASPPNRDVLAGVVLTEAQAALSRGLFEEAAAKAQRALEAAQGLGAQGRHFTAEADFTRGLAEAASGAADRGWRICEESLRTAAAVEDPWYSPNSRLALAEALLAEGSARRAHDEALAAREAFARLGRAESEWRALAVAGRAALLAGDSAEARDLFTRASALLSALEQSWGDAAAPYLARPDVQQLRKGLGGDLAAVRH